MVELRLIKDMPTLIVVWCLLVAVLGNLQRGEAGIIRNYSWDVKYEYKSPDCYKKLVITVNGTTPGPTIEAEEGDTVIVQVNNSLITENLAIHWHGIRQIETPWFDGTEGVSQCPILPGDTFEYKFVVDRAGTYLYHAHYGIQREAGLYGLIIVNTSRKSEPFAYDYDRSIILDDWFHKSTYEQVAGLSSIPFQWVGEPQSLLINGKGRFNCSLSPIAGICNETNPECAPYSEKVIYGKTYRLRIGSLTTLSALSFQIQDHKMTVVEADGHYVEPFEVDNLFIYSGETYSVLVKTDAEDRNRNYWITSNVVSRDRTTPHGLAILNYWPTRDLKLPPTPPPTPPAWDDIKARLAQSLAIKAHKDFIQKPPKTSDRVIVLLNTQNTIKGYRKWSLNNVSFSLPHTPYLVALKYNLTDAFDQTPPPEGYDSANYDIYSVQKNTHATSSNGIYRLEFNSTVDIILQNANTMNTKSSETHPWHLHGHDFWVLGYGNGKFEKEKDPKNYNLENPILKNTVPVHPYGWTALRFKANNPGVWLFHCHIDSHFYMGMGVVFAEGIDKVGELPSSIMGCGKTKTFGLNTTNPSNHN